MMRFRLFALVLAVPLAAGLVALSGCGSKDKDAKVEGGGGSGTGSGSGSGSGSGAKEVLASSGVATIKGQVTYDGDAPKADLKETMEKQVKEKKDLDHCLKGPTADPTWIVGPNKGVANVVVWIRPPKGRIFKIPDDQKKRTDQVVIDQPFCAFNPHVVVLYPSYYDSDTKKQKSTGQIFKITNTAPINHNTATKGNSLFNPSKNVILNAKEGTKVSELIVPAKPCADNSAGGEDRITINCDIHKWMTASAWAFDHPWAVKTNEDGTFEIKDVPAGADINVTAWHEGMPSGGWCLAEGKDGKKINIKPGETYTLDFKIKK